MGQIPSQTKIKKKHQGNGKPSVLSIMHLNVQDITANKVNQFEILLDTHLIYCVFQNMS